MRKARHPLDLLGSIASMFSLNIPQKEIVDESLDDISITALVEKILLHHLPMSYIKITVETKNGVVKLDGTVKNWSEKNLITKIANDVSGVKMVFNNMNIERVSLSN